MSHGENVKVVFYLGIKPKVHDSYAKGKPGPHVREASAVKVWSNPPGQQDDLLVIPVELELPEEAFLPTMPKVSISIPIESIGEAQVTVKGGIKRLDTTKRVERKLS